MRTALRLLLLATTALAALAFTASASAQDVTVENEESTELCPTVSSPPVTGGCHVEFEAEENVPLFAHIPGVGEVPQSDCEVSLEARIGPDGEGYVVDAALDPPHQPALANCTREPCMTDGRVDAWPLHIEEHGVGNEEIEITFCLSEHNQMETKTDCTLHLPLTQTGHHQEVTAVSTDRCEENPAVSIDGHFNSHEDETEVEEIEIHHPEE